MTKGRGDDRGERELTPAENLASLSDWKRRLLISGVYAAIAVFVSTAIALSLSTLENPATVPRHGVSGIELAGDVVGFPLITGWIFVSLVFGEWRAVHGGQIVLVPFISAAIDWMVIFLVWEFVHRKKSRDLTADEVLHINR
jgi:hypothetical protein